MGWYGDTIDCPNCGEKDTAECQFRNDCTSLLTVKCVKCGLTAHAPDRVWIFETSYIDETIIGKDPEKLDMDYEEINKRQPKENILKGKPLNMF